MSSINYMQDATGQVIEAEAEHLRALLLSEQMFSRTLSLEGTNFHEEKKHSIESDLEVIAKQIEEDEKHLREMGHDWAIIIAHESYGDPNLQIPWVGLYYNDIRKRLQEWLKEQVKIAVEEKEAYLKEQNSSCQHCGRAYQVESPPETAVLDGSVEES